MTSQGTEQATRPAPWKTAIQLAVSILLVALTLFFLAWAFYANWEEIRQYDWRLNLPLLVLSFAVLIASHLMDLGAWWQAIVRMGQRLPYWRALRLYLVAYLGKYIPGTVWQFLGWFYLAEREGVPGTVVGPSLLLTQAISVLVGTALAIAALAAVGSRDVILQLVPLLVLLLASIFLLQPRILAKILNRGLQLARRPPVSIDLSFHDIIVIFAAYFFAYCLWGTALFIFTSALTPLPVIYLVPFLGIFPAAYSAGLLAQFDPGGIGVREAALAYLLSFFVPLPVAIVAGLLTRPWIMAMDVGGGMAALVSYALAGRSLPLLRRPLAVALATPPANVGDAGKEDPAIASGEQDIDT